MARDSGGKSANIGLRAKNALGDNNSLCPQSPDENSPALYLYPWGKISSSASPIPESQTLALLRRGTHRDAPVLKVHTLELDRTSRTVRRDGKVITLTTKEFSLLEYLMRQPGVVHTRSMIAEHVWDFTLELGSNVVDVYVKHLRDKIDDKDRPDRPSFVQSVRGVGYVLRDPDADQA